MIRTMTVLECDCCPARIEYGAIDEHVIVHDARRLGWNMEYRPTRHHCPACKVAAKLAQELEAAK